MIKINMDTSMRLLGFIIMLWGISVFSANTITVIPQDSEVVIPEKANAFISFAAKDLRNHLKSISGKDIKLLTTQTASGNKYKFFVGIKFPGDKKKLAPEEARWVVTPQATYLYGEDFCRKPELQNSEKHVVKDFYNRTGTLFAVYSFLDSQLGVKWLSPGKSWTVIRKQAVFHLQEGRFAWNSKLVQRHMRHGETWSFYQKRFAAKIPTEFKMTRKAVSDREYQVMLWEKRMRLGRKYIIPYGHAFTKWWAKYGKTHPEYFALIAPGKRGPWAKNRPDRVKMCVSNKELHKQIVKDWDWNKYKTINVCGNDSRGYCTCAKCRALDVMDKGESIPTGGATTPYGFEKALGSLSDRYLYFANEVLKEAKKTHPDAEAVMYAYYDYRKPPRKQRVAPGVIVVFVPSMMKSKEVEEMYKGWHDAGAQKMILRPNDQWLSMGLPMGFAKSMFDNFQLGIKYGVIGTDYDMFQHFGPATDFADYILARAQGDPGKPYEYWENEYCSTFGAAKDAVKKYYAYWRKNIWEKRLLPNFDAICKRGRYGNFRRGVMWDLPKYYKKTDFDRTDAILRAGASKKLSSSEKMRLNKLRLANWHARLTYEAVCNKEKASAKLIRFRIANKKKLNIYWPCLLAMENHFGNITGMNTVAIPKRFTYKQDMDLLWYFKIDPENVGINEKWQNYSLADIQKNWDLIQSNTSWEKLTSKHTPDKLKKRLKNYDGIGWYAQSIKIDKKFKDKEICLLFGAVDESCWVYVNGKLVKTRIHKNKDDWQTPFTVCINKAIDWNKKQQLIVVRVEDKCGAGGIWKEVSLVIAK